MTTTGTEAPTRPDRGETERLAALRAYALLDAPAGHELEAAVRVAAMVAGVPTATLNIIDESRQCQLAAVGFVGTDSPRADSMCAVRFRSGCTVHVPDASRDPVYAGNPWVTGELATVRLYASVPLVTPEGHALGTLCAFDEEPRALSDQQLAGLQDVAGVVSALLERRRAARELAASEQRFRSMFEDSPVGIGLSNERGHFVAANAALCRLLGREESELRGSSSAPFTHPDDLGSQRGAGALIDASPDGTVRIEKRYLRPSGEVRWAWLTVTHVDGPQGRSWTLAHVQDVTERKAAEQALADSEANLAAVGDVVRRIRTGEDARTSIVEAARRIAAATSTWLIEADGEDALRITRSTGQDLTGTRIPLSEPSVTAQVWQSGEVVHVPDRHQHPLGGRGLAGMTEARSLLWQPVQAHGRVSAVLGVAWSDRVTDLSDRAARAVALLADETAVALEYDDLLAQYALLARTDQLTGLPNRRAWDERLAHLMAAADRSAGPLVVAVADLDHFKAYNDTHGHGRGDQLLTSVAASLRSGLRTVDLVARWGGEEFALALPDCEPADAAAVLDRVRATVPEGQTVSIGYAVWDGHETARSVVDRADRALYAAKATGRDQVVADHDVA